MNDEKNAAFMVDLLMGTDYAGVFEEECAAFEEAERAEAFEQLEEIVDRLRAQTIHIVAALRAWNRQYKMARHPVERRYLAYEGVLCKQDLRQHWRLYRQALRELSLCRPVFEGNDNTPPCAPITGRPKGSGYGKRRRTSRRKVA